ncbi:iron-sulfur cluster insertion protein ErpA [Candidatus Erwinia haradaeae]
MMDHIVPSIHITDSAVNRVKQLTSHEKQPHLNLRVYIIGGGCGGFQYGFSLDNQIHDEDVVVQNAGVVLVVDPMSLQYLSGGSVDYIEDLEGSRFTFNNPNAKTTCGCGSSFSI